MSTLLESALDPRSFDFSQTSGAGVSGNLGSPGAGKVLTFVTLPFGLEIGNSIRISGGGTGTAEAVLITGVSGTAGDVGTATVTTANSHTGPWVAGSASAGIQEAIGSIVAYGSVEIPDGAWSVYATINVPPSKQVGIYGHGIAASALLLQFAAGDAIYYDASTFALVSIGDFRFDPQFTRTSGYDLHVKGATFGDVDHLYTRNTLNGFEFENCNSIQVDSLRVQSFTGNAFFLNSSGSPTSGGFYSKLNAIGVGSNALLIQATTGTAFAGTTISDCNFQLAANLINMVPNGGVLNEFEFNNIILDSHSVRGVWLQGGTGTGNGIVFNNVRFGTSSGAGFAFGVFSNWSNIQFIGMTGGFAGEGIVLFGAKNVGIHNTHIAGDGSGSGGNIPLLLTDDGGVPCTNIQVDTSTFGFAENGAITGGTATAGISVSAAAHTVEFRGVDAYGSAIGFASLCTGTCRITDCRFLNSTKPTASAVYRQSTWYTDGGAGVADTFEVCRKDAADAHAWVGLF